MKTNKLLIRLLVRLMKKYHLYEAFSLGLTENKIINRFNNYKRRTNSFIVIQSLIDDIRQVSSIQLDYEKCILIRNDLNKILCKLLYNEMIDFLNKKKIFTLFNDNIKLYGSKNYENFDEYIELFIKKNFDIRTLITYAFVFRNTQEGYDFWSDIHNQYILYINDLLIKNEEK